VVVFSNDGVAYHLADGFHRVEAHRLAHPEQEIDCEIHPGDHDDALLFACGANASHGLPRSNEDKRKAALLLLNSEKWSRWSDREIARQCKVSPPLVAKLRSEHLKTFTDAHQKDHASRWSPTDAPAAASDRRRKFTRAGKSSSMKTGAIGSGSPRSSRRKSADSAPPLSSLSWSEASEAERIKFVRDVGGREILDAFKRITPGFSIVDWGWKKLGQAERQAFVREHLEEIKALAKSSGSALPAKPTEAPIDTPQGLRPDEDPLAIPPVKKGSAE
jgi:hypothetical protein